jgi:hypothetical protein
MQVRLEGEEADYLRSKGVDVDDLVTQMVKILANPVFTEAGKKRELGTLLEQLFAQLTPRQALRLIPVVLNAIQTHPAMPAPAMPLAHEAINVAYEDLLRKMVREIIVAKEIIPEEKTFRIGKLFEIAILADEPQAQEQVARRVLEPLEKEKKPLSPTAYKAVTESAVRLVPWIRGLRKAATKKAGPREEEPLVEEARAMLGQITKGVPPEMMESRYQSLARDIPDDQPDEPSKLQAADRLRRAWEGRKLTDDELIALLLRIAENSKLSPQDQEREIIRLLNKAGEGLSLADHRARLQRLRDGVRAKAPRNERFHTLLDGCIKQTLHDRVLDEVQRISDDKQVPPPAKVDRVADILDTLFAGKSWPEERQEFAQLLERGRKRLTPEALELLYKARLKGLMRRKDIPADEKQREIQRLLDEMLRDLSPEDIDALLKRLLAELGLPEDEQARLRRTFGRMKHRKLAARRAAEDKKKPINTYDAVDAANVQGRQLLVYEDDVLDIEERCTENPAEARVLQPLLGREVGQLVYRKQLPDLTNEQKSGKIKDGMPAAFYAELPTGKDPAKVEWKIEIQDGLTDIFYRVTFSNPHIALHRLHSQTRHFGKYVTVVRKTEGTARNFVVPFSMQGGLDLLHARLAAAINSGKTEGRFPTDGAATVAKELSIVATSKPKFSSWLINVNTEPEDPSDIELFYIRGPFVSWIDTGVGTGNALGPAAGWAGGVLRP